MIKFNNSDIIDWNFDDSNIIKVYHNGAIVFYKFDIEQGGYKVCYAVVDDITQYSETEFEDVYDKATEKWYKLNNLNQYEEYGVYGDSISSGSSRLPQGYTEVEYIRNSNYNAYINTGAIPFDNTTNSYTITTKLTSEFHSNLECATIISCENPVGTYYGLGYRYKCSSTVDQFEFYGSYPNYSSSTVDNGDGTRTITFQSTGNTSWTISTPLSYFCSFNSTSYDSNSAYRFSDATIYSSTIIKNDVTIRDFVPAKRNSDSVYGLYDLINNVFYTSPNGNNFSGGQPVSNVATTYEGKLAIVDGYEYMYSGSSWVNVGEVSGSSRVPQGYTEVEYIENTATGTNYYIDTQFKPNQDTRVVLEAQASLLTNNPRMFGSGPWNGLAFVGNIENATPQKFYFKYGQTSSWYTTNVQADTNKHTFDLNKNSYYIDGVLANTASTTTFQLTTNLGIFNAPSTSLFTDGETFVGKVFSCKIYDNGTLIRDYAPCKRDSDSKSGLYDVVNNVFYTAVNTSYNFTPGAETGSTEYPLYYDEKADPLNNLSFSSMTEAQDYAYNNCVYDGMKATIDGDRYYFDSDDENGWVKVTEYYIVEDVTPGGASGWTISGSSTYNPDSSYYDDFDLQTTSTSSSYKIAKVTIYGYGHFTYYLRSSGYSTYSYVMASNIDELSTDPTSMGYNSNSAITNTCNYNKSPGSAVNLSNYRRVTYNNLDKTVEHTFYVVFYGRTYSSYVSNATILIPKEQTNENWEQVTFSASSNVASTAKSLYIDNSYTSNGGTSYFYYRWMVGLPAGSHSSYTNYSNYNYCPNVTSSTFTSVAGEQRQVNFTYDNTTNKTLSFRLTDGSNVLTPSDTVYFNMTYYNSCNKSSSSSNVTFPRSQSVKVGGRFRFANSSNRHYIYGYSPNISLNTDYYVDNYQSTFDITYTKLSEEVVTVTYTTYDPSDTEVPAFKTDITWPYSGGTTSSTTLTSYDVPYTYSYKVSQTSDKFSAASQSYTAGQASRTINFVLYPNNREFTTVADMEAYAYAWEGMKAIVGDTNYKYENGEWVEYAGIIWLDPKSSGSLSPSYPICHYWGEGYKMIYTLYINGSYSTDTGSFWNYNSHSPIEFNFYSNGFYYDFHNPTSTTAPNVYTGDYSWRIMNNSSLSSYQNGQILNVILTNGAVRVELESTGAAIVTGSTSVTAQNWYSGLYQATIGYWVDGNKVHIKQIQVYNENDVLVNDLTFVKNPNVTGSQEISVYDSVLNVKYDNTNSNTPLYHIEI